jgi:YHS domain-containing protein
MAKDPICGMTVDEASALRAERDGRTFYFCSEHCQKKFLSTPATTKHEEKKEQKPQGKTIYTCPMHPEVQQDHPGNCPKCGMTSSCRRHSELCFIGQDATGLHAVANTLPRWKEHEHDSKKTCHGSNTAVSASI